MELRDIHAIIDKMPLWYAKVNANTLHFSMHMHADLI